MQAVVVASGTADDVAVAGTAELSISTVVELDLALVIRAKKLLTVVARMVLKEWDQLRINTIVLNNFRNLISQEQERWRLREFEKVKCERMELGKQPRDCHSHDTSCVASARYMTPKDSR